MNDVALNEVEVVSLAEVHRAARAFAAAIAETPQFAAFRSADEVLSNDAEAQRALSRLQAKVRSLRALLMLNAVSEAERAELDQLKIDYMTRPTVQAYAAACGASCCG